VNERNTQCNDDRKAFSRARTQALDDAHSQTAWEVIHTVATVSRGLKCADSAIKRIVQTASSSSDLTLAQWLILVQLLRAQTCKQNDLHSETGIASGYLTRLLDELDAKGMVYRRRSAGDRRQILLSLTDRGGDAARSLLASIGQHRLFAALCELESSLDSFLSICAGPR
jgi:DNA-binding MarR family transcriptional regulator